MNVEIKFNDSTKVVFKRDGNIYSACLAADGSVASITSCTNGFKTYNADRCAALYADLHAALTA